MMWHDALVKQLIKVKAGGSREEKIDVWQIVSAQGVEDDPGGPVLGVTYRATSQPTSSPPQSSCTSFINKYNLASRS